MEEIKQRGGHFKLIARSPELALTHTRVDHATLGSRFSACKKTVIGRFLSALAHMLIDCVIFETLQYSTDAPVFLMGSLAEVR